MTNWLRAGETFEDSPEWCDDGMVHVALYDRPNHLSYVLGGHPFNPDHLTLFISHGGYAEPYFMRMVTTFDGGDGIDDIVRWLKRCQEVVSKALDGVTILPAIVLIVRATFIGMGYDVKMAK